MKKNADACAAQKYLIGYEEEGKSSEEQFEEFRRLLPPNDPCYCVYDFEEKLILITW